MDTKLLKEAFVLSKLSDTLSIVNYKDEILIIINEYAYTLDIVPMIMYYGPKNLIPYDHLEKIETIVYQKLSILKLKNDDHLLSLRDYLVKNPDIFSDLLNELGKYLHENNQQAD